MRDDKDRGSKWLIERHGDSILRGVRGFRAWRAAPAEVVRPRHGRGETERAKRVRGDVP